jgi:hypothetical protein
MKFAIADQAGSEWIDSIIKEEMGHLTLLGKQLASIKRDLN